MKIHPSADVSKTAIIGKSTKVWHQAQIRENVKIGKNCIIGKGAYIDLDTQIGDNVKIQNYASLYHTTKIENGVFIGPYVCITNDKLPRAITKDGKLKGNEDWQAYTTTIKTGASIGAGTIILPGLEIGEYSLIGAGSLVSQHVLPHALMYGSPATLHGFVCKCGNVLTKSKKKPKIMLCKDCLEND